MADIAASVLAKLRNKAKASGISYQQCLQLFVQEEFLRKLSKSGCEDTLILKGGLFIYTLTNFESRATIDVDFLLRGYSNTIDDVKELICKIIDTPTGNDYIEMRAKGFEEISPQRKYHGISTQIIAQIKNVRVPFNVDIGVGDIIVPRAEERTINTQLPDFEAPVIKTYSLESTILTDQNFISLLQFTAVLLHCIGYGSLWQICLHIDIIHHHRCNPCKWWNQKTRRNHNGTKQDHINNRFQNLRHDLLSSSVFLSVNSAFSISQILSY